MTIGEVNILTGTVTLWRKDDKILLNEKMGGGSIRKEKWGGQPLPDSKEAK